MTALSNKRMHDHILVRPRAHPARALLPGITEELGLSPLYIPAGQSLSGSRKSRSNNPVVPALRQLPHRLAPPASHRLVCSVHRPAGTSPSTDPRTVGNDQSLCAPQPFGGKPD